MKIRARGGLDISAYSSTWGTDYAQTTDADSLSFEMLNAFIGEIVYQPPWRARADIEADYYDSNQYTAADLSSMESKGIPPIVVNLIAPAINMVLGMEAKTRTDWVVKAETDDYEDEALALGVKLKEAERLSKADRAISDAYAAQVKVGLGWVEVGYNKFNPFGYKYRCNYVHRREIWWDWHDMDPGLEMSRYLVRRRWFDQDVAMKYFPTKKKLIQSLTSESAMTNMTNLDTADAMYIDRTLERDFSWGEEEWLDKSRKRVCLYEVWYRVMVQGFILRFGNDRIVEFDDKNPTHRAAIMAGAAYPEAAVIPKMRLSWWIGPHRLADMPTPYPHQDFPYIPFWGFREDRSGVPYGMIRSMRPLQDEVNARRAKMLWQLSAKTVFVDEDAVPNHKQLQQEIARPDAYVKINTMKGKRPIGDLIKVQDNSALTNQQFQVYQDSKQTLQDAGGVYQEQLGKKGGGADSGIAISQLIEQGTTTLAEINDNAQTARTLVGNRLLALIVNDMKGKPITIKIDKVGVKRKVNFNQPAKDETTGVQYLDNDVTRMQMSVALADVPQTSTYRMQQFMQLTDFVKTLPPEVQVQLLDIVVNASDIPDKKEVLARMRSALGIGQQDPDTMTPEEQAQAQKVAEQADEIKQLQMQLAKSNASLQDAKVGLTEAQTSLTYAQTELTLVEADGKKVDSGLHPELSRHAPGPDETITNTKGLAMMKKAEQSPIKVAMRNRDAAPSNPPVPSQSPPNSVPPAPVNAGPQSPSPNPQPAMS